MDQSLHRNSSFPEPHTNNGSSTPSDMLPADDGMQALRQQMQEICKLAESTEEIAKRMHALMTKDFLARRQHAVEDRIRRASVVNQELPADLGSNPYNLTPEDLLPSYNPELEYPDDDDDDVANDGKRDGGGVVGETEEQEMRLGRPILGCVHYQRNVKIQCFDCKLWFPCRHCHDASPNLPFAHALNRRMTQNMLCMKCQKPQPASDFCVECEEETAYYYCSICKLWDNDSRKRIYHCDDCGICRVGEGLGRDYVHCKRCNVCISIATSTSHPCIERATECDCPLCLDFLFSSSSAVVSLLCGHYMHGECYKELMNVTYRCPVCSKSAVNMELQWRKLDDEIRIQPMPEEDFEVSGNTEQTAQRASTDDEALAASTRNLTVSSDAPPMMHRRRLPRRVWIGCNDCGGRGWTNFHWLGLKCPVCDGYNTNQITPVGDSAARPSVVAATQLQRQHDFTGADAIRSFGGPSVLDDAGLISTDDSPDVLNVAAMTVPAGAAATIATTPSHITGAQQALPPRRSYFLQPEVQGTTYSSSPSRLSIPSPHNVINTITNGGARTISPNRSERGEADPNTTRRVDGETPRSVSPSASLASGWLNRFGRSLSPVRAYLEEFERRSSFAAGAAADAVRSPVFSAASGWWGKDEGAGAGAGSGGAGDAPVAAASAADGSVGSGRAAILGNGLHATTTAAGARLKDGGVNGDGHGDDDEAVEFWGSDGHFLSGEEEEDEDGEEESEDDSEDEERDKRDGEEDEDDDEESGFGLIGHR